MHGRNDILPILKLFLGLYATVLFLQTGLGLLNTFLSLRLSMEGLPAQATGMVLTAYFVGLTAGTFLCRRIIRSVGHIRAYAAFAAVGITVVMVHGLYFSSFVWLGLRFISGVANMGFFMVIESWFNECANVRFRGRVFSIYMIMTYLGSTIGQKLLSLGQVQTQTLFLVVGIFIALSIIPVTVTRSIHPNLPRIEKIRFKTILQKAPIGMSGCFTAGMLNSAFYAMGPVFAYKINLDVSQLSWFMALSVLGGLLFQWPVGALSDRIDRSLMLPCQGVVVAGISLLGLLAGRGSIEMFLGISALFGGILFTIYPVAVARAHDMFEPQDVVKVSSSLLLAFGVGSVIGPMVCSTVMTMAGTPYGYYYYFIGGACLFAVFTGIWRRRESVRIVPAEEQVDFVIMKQTSHVVSHMDPRLIPRSELQQR
jgi:MFS family permease